MDLNLEMEELVNINGTIPLLNITQTFFVEYEPSTTPETIARSGNLPQWYESGKIMIPLYAVICMLAVVGNTLVILTLGWLKLFVVAFKREPMQKMIINLNKFWGVGNIKTNTITIVKLYQNGYFTVAILAIIVFTCRPYITSELPVLSHIPEYVPYPIFITFNSVALAMYGSLSIAIDLFVSTTLLLLALQFRILSRKIQEIKFYNLTTKNELRKCHEDIKLCAKHHEFLLDPNNMLEVSKALSVFSVLCIQTTILYTWPASCLTEEAFSVLNGVYNSDWINYPYTSIRKQLIIIMQRSQEDVNVVAGKFLIVNMTTSTMVFKTSYMFFTYLNTMG